MNDEPPGVKCRDQHELWERFDQKSPNNPAIVSGVS